MAARGGGGCYSDSDSESEGCGSQGSLDNVEAKRHELRKFGRELTRRSSMASLSGTQRTGLGAAAAAPRRTHSASPEGSPNDKSGGRWPAIGSDIAAAVESDCGSGSPGKDAPSPMDHRTYSTSSAGDRGAMEDDVATPLDKPGEAVVPHAEKPGMLTDESQTEIIDRASEGDSSSSGRGDTDSAGIPGTPPSPCTPVVGEIPVHVDPVAFQPPVAAVPKEQAQPAQPAPPQPSAAKPPPSPKISPRSRSPTPSPKRSKEAYQLSASDQPLIEANEFALKRAGLEIPDLQHLVLVKVGGRVGLKLDDSQVADVQPGGAAERAGLEIGMCLVAVNGQLTAPGCAQSVDATAALMNAPRRVVLSVALDTSSSASSSPAGQQHVDTSPDHRPADVPRRTTPESEKPEPMVEPPAAAMGRRRSSASPPPLPPSRIAQLKGVHEPQATTADAAFAFMQWRRVASSAAAARAARCLHSFPYPSDGFREAIAEVGTCESVRHGAIRKALRQWHPYLECPLTVAIVEAVVASMPVRKASQAVSGAAAAAPAAWWGESAASAADDDFSWDAASMSSGEDDGVDLQWPLAPPPLSTEVQKLKAQLSSKDAEIEKLVGQYARMMEQVMVPAGGPGSFKGLGSSHNSAFSNTQTHPVHEASAQSLSSGQVTQLKLKLEEATKNQEQLRRDLALKTEEEVRLSARLKEDHERYRKERKDLHEEMQRLRKDIVRSREDQDAHAMEDELREHVDRNWELQEKIKKLSSTLAFAADALTRLGIDPARFAGDETPPEPLVASCRRRLNQLLDSSATAVIPERLPQVSKDLGHSQSGVVSPQTPGDSMRWGTFEGVGGGSGRAQGAQGIGRDGGRVGADVQSDGGARFDNFRFGDANDCASPQLAYSDSFVST
eukprot:TRINITY_DN7773_c2_g1_i3.p1 TRINITY_DN7773_c2_g1~~TRINITY_DN7773_c2_g1_i3.p1  ORF type:complete len:895 (+),score=43.68 TRINITY_DN7773_c2_g1_i3:175-2859(+)